MICASVTKGKRPAFKIRYFLKLMDQSVLTTGYIEIFFLVPSANIENLKFTVSEVTGQGQLADFSADDRKYKRDEIHGDCLGPDNWDGAALIG